MLYSAGNYGYGDFAVHSMLYGEYRYGFATYTGTTLTNAQAAVTASVASSATGQRLRSSGLEITAVSAFASIGQRIHLAALKQASHPSLYGGYVYGAVDYSAPRITHPITAVASTVASGQNIFQKSAALSAAASSAISGNITAASGASFSAVASILGAGQLTVVGMGQVTADSSALFSGNITAVGATTMPGAATLNIVGTILWEDSALSSTNYVDINLASNTYSDVNLTNNSWEAA